MSRWIELYKTSPSGKTLFVCKMCGTISPVPSKECSAPPEVVAWKMALDCSMLEEIEDALLEENHQAPLYNLLLQVSKTSSGTTVVSWRTKDNEHRAAELSIEKETTK